MPAGKNRPKIARELGLLIHRILLLPVASALLLTACATSDPGLQHAESSNPISFAKRAELDRFLDEIGSQSLLILKDGKIAYQYGDTHQRLAIHSIRKAVLSSLIGIAVSKGQIDLDATLAELDIDDVEPSLTEQEKQARVIDLLRSRSGVYHDSAANSPGMLANRPQRGAHSPGEYFYYNNWDFNALGGILEQATGQSIYDLFDEQLAQPLGMLDWQGEVITLYPDDTEFPDTDGFYQHEPEQSKFPAYHFRLSAHDLALYGQLMLQKGQWHGEQIVPAEWIKQSIQPQSEFIPQANLHYGMLWIVRLNEAG